jgi:hypothetical protein
MRLQPARCPVSGVITSGRRPELLLATMMFSTELP